MHMFIIGRSYQCQHIVKYKKYWFESEINLLHFLLRPSGSDPWKLAMSWTNATGCVLTLQFSVLLPI